MVSEGDASDPHDLTLECILWNSHNLKVAWFRYPDLPQSIVSVIKKTQEIVVYYFLCFKAFEDSCVLVKNEILISKHLLKC